MSTTTIDKPGTMFTGGSWHEVSKAEPCPICQKPDWCATSADGVMVACRREKDGAIKVDTDKSGGEFYLHKIGETSTDYVRPVSPAKTARQAAPEVLDKIYRALLAMSRLSKTAHEDLERRGLSKGQIKAYGYGSLRVDGRQRIGRTLHERFGDDLRKMPGFFWKKGATHPTIAGPCGMLIPVRDKAGRIVALKIRRLEGKGPKYVYLSSKKHGGPGPGAPVHVSLGVTGPIERLRITEGELKADVATHLDGPTLSVPGVGSWRFAMPVLRELSVKTAVLAYDADAMTNADVARHLRNFYKAIVKADFEVELERWDPADGKGIDDLLAAGKKPEVITGDEAMQAIDEIAKAAGALDGDGEVIVITPDEKRVVDQAIAALTQHPGVYQRGGALTHVVRDVAPPRGIERAKDSPRIVPILRPRLREILATVATWARPAGDDLEPCHPADWAVKAVDARGEWAGIRRLENVVEVPVLRADGSILQTPGYDPETGLLFEPMMEYPAVPEKPTRADAQRAVKILLDVVADFPFATEAHKAAWLSGMLTPLARYAFFGPAPFHIADANIRGAGKSLLMDAIALVVYGRTMARMTLPRDDDELRKRITAMAIAGEPLILIDNVAGTLGSPSLDAALTATTWSDRILGESRMASNIPLSATWYATGNNIVLAADTARRVLHIRLESPEENPEERSGFQHPDLLGWVRRKRPQFVVAALTILRAYCAAGRPDMKLRPWGSFEGWSDLVRQAIVWAGTADPGDTRTELATRADREAVALRGLIDGWVELDPKREGITVSAAMKLVANYADEYETLRFAITELVSAPAGKFPSARSIGMKLHHLRRRVVGGQFLDSRYSRKGALWFVCVPEKCATNATSGTNSGYPTHEKPPQEKPVRINTGAVGISPASTASPAPSNNGDCRHLPKDRVEQQRDGRACQVCGRCGALYGYLRTT